MAIRALLWDVGGVLLRTEDPAPRQRWEQRLGLPPGRLVDTVFGCPAAQRASIGESSDEEVWNEAAGILGVPLSERAQFKKDFFAGDRWDEELFQLIRRLHPAYRMGVLSNAWPDARATMAAWIRPDIFDAILFSAEEKMRKPEERFYRLALARLGATPEETLFIDDFLENVEGARKMGIQAVQFQGTTALLERIRDFLRG